MANRGKGYSPPLDNISEAVGNAPLVKVSELALTIIKSAEKDGSLKPRQTVVEATSGDTGIAVAMMCA